MNPDLREPILVGHPVGSSDNTNLPLTMVIYEKNSYKRYCTIIFYNKEILSVFGFLLSATVVAER